jgi:1,4-dihydroxy-2-naphthoate octaprenyltransferase
VVLRLFVNTNFFDIKDIDSDRKEGLLTLPIILSKENFLIFLHIANFISFLPIIIGISKQIIPSFSLSLLLLYFYSFYSIEKARRNRINIHFFSYVIVDGEYLFWPFLLFLGKFLTNLW